MTSIQPEKVIKAIEEKLFKSSLKESFKSIQLALDCRSNNLPGLDLERLLKTELGSLTSKVNISTSPDVSIEVFSVTEGLDIAGKGKRKICILSDLPDILNKDELNKLKQFSKLLVFTKDTKELLMREGISSNSIKIIPIPFIKSISKDSTRSKSIALYIDSSDSAYSSNIENLLMLCKKYDFNLFTYVNKSLEIDKSIFENVNVIYVDSIYDIPFSNHTIYIELSKYGLVRFACLAALANGCYAIDFESIRSYIPEGLCSKLNHDLYVYDIEEMTSKLEVLKLLYDKEIPLVDNESIESFIKDHCSIVDGLVELICQEFKTMS